MSDQQFPILNISSANSYLSNGQAHGETFRDGIKELVNIRKQLMLEKNIKLKDHLSTLAHEQYLASEKFSPEITKELLGISQGSNTKIEDIVILNNYTDFRDIILPDEGCSTVHIKKDDISFCGQTWDMHRSAKKYVSLINLQGSENTPGVLLFSLVGCVGMMGFSSNNLMIGVNNLNTKNAKSSIIWPVLVRHILEKSTNFNSMKEILSNSQVTSGHNYLISSPQESQHWEVLPDVQESVSTLHSSDSNGHIFHTNHCLGEKAKLYEEKMSINSTTINRYNLLEKKLPLCNNLEDLKSVLMDHDEYPKSICSHYEGSSQDPSSTCGGAVGSFTENQYYFWRGCKVYDDNFKDYCFSINEKSFKISN